MEFDSIVSIIDLRRDDDRRSSRCTGGRQNRAYR